MLITGIITSAVANEADWMPDATLQSAVREALGLADNEPLTQEKMLELTTLTETNSTIGNLQGLEFATNLLTFAAWRNNFSDLTPLSNLTSLTDLRIGNNDISDVSPLAGLTNLTKLGLTSNNISNVSALSGLVNLTWLLLANNPVTDFSPLSGLKANIKHVDISIPDPVVPNPVVEVERDTTRPGVSISLPSGTQNGAFDATLTFSEAVSNFLQEDLSLSGTATASVTAWSANTENTVYTATITPTTSGTVTVGVAANVATDAAENNNTAATSQTVPVSIDVESPSVSISVPSDVQNGAFSATITFTEAVAGFAQSELSLTGTATAAITAWNTVDSTTYTATITPTTSGTVTVGVAANVATDAANNANTVATSQTVTVDVDRPTVSISVPSGTQTGAFDATLTFSETVSGFEQSDVSLSGSAASITGWRANNDNTVYTATITPTASGTVTIGIAANVATDAANNQNTAASPKTVTVNIPDPIPDPATWMPDANLRAAVRSALSLGNNDTLTQAGMADLTSLTARNAQISNLTGLEHATNLQKLDLRDNTISNISALSGLTGLESLKLKGNGISRVSDLSGLSNLTLLNLKENNISSISELSGLTNLEHLRVDENSITDVQPLMSLVNLEQLWIAGNSLTNAYLLSSLTGLTYIDIPIPDPPDTTAPSVSISVPSGTQNGAFDATLTFSEAVSNFLQEDLSLSGTASATLTGWSANTENTIYTATITPTTSGTVTLNVAANVATDTANNGNTAATEKSITVDLETPLKTPLNIPPVFTDGESTTRAIDENTAADTNIGTPVAATDADNDTLTYTLGGTDAESFGIVRTSGQLRTSAALDYERKTSYSVTITVSDGKLTDTIAVTINVTDVDDNRAPVFLLSNIAWSIEIDGDTATGANIGAPVSATDADNDTLTYTLGGTDAAAFDIDSTTGQLQATAAFISDTRSVYSVTVTAADGNGGSTSVPVRVTASRVAQQTGNDDITPVSERTSQVRDAIVAAVSGVDSAGDVTETHLAAITKLDLDEKEISELQSGDFDGLTGMTFLNLYDNELTSLPADIFSGLTALKRLNVGYNDLAELPANLFSGLSALEDLSLEGNEMTTLPANLFSGLSALKELKLQFSALDALPANVFSGLSALKVLNIDYNSLDALPADIFDGLSALKQLKVGYNDLAEIPADMFSELTALEELKLSGNHELATLPENLFSGLTALKVLRLYDIDLDNNFPADLFDGLSSLEFIDLGHNQMGSIPAGLFDDLSSLKALHLHYNSLNSLRNQNAFPEGVFSDLSALETLQMDHNYMIWAPPADLFDGLSALKKLYLNDNYLGNRSQPLPAGLFDGLTSLTTLYMFSNSLYNLPAGLFSDLTSLTTLTLQKNNIRDISALEDLTSLDSLWLHNNRVRDVSPLEDLTSLTRLKLAGNSISDFGPLRTLVAAIEALPDHPGLDLDITIPEEEGNGAPSAQATPIQTELLANFPNPFNPETWIPYHLAKASNVQITIYDARGAVVRRLELGHQRAGIYTSRRRAAHWDGKNDVGEKVASGLYFYQLQADNMSLLRKMVILK